MNIGYGATTAASFPLLSSVALRPPSDSPLHLIAIRMTDTGPTGSTIVVIVVVSGRRRRRRRCRRYRWAHWHCHRHPRWRRCRNMTPDRLNSWR